MLKLTIQDGHIDNITIVGDMKRDNGIPMVLQYLTDSLDPRIYGPYRISKFQYDGEIQIKTFESTALVQVYSRKRNSSDFRIEFNPAKCSEDDMKLIHHLLSMVKDKRCTRIDLCINFHDDVMGYKLVDGRLRSEVEYRNATGRTETLYRGSDRSKDRLKLYDKKKEQKDVKNKDIEHDWCRIEETIKENKAECYKDWEWFKGVKLVNSEPTFPPDIDPKDRMVARCITAGLGDITELKKDYRTKIQRIIGSATYEDEFNLGEEIKKTSIVSQTNEVINQLLSDKPIEKGQSIGLALFCMPINVIGRHMSAL